MTKRKAVGYEVRCSRRLAEALGAYIGVYRGRNVLHWNGGFLWWVI